MDKREEVSPLRATQSEMDRSYEWHVTEITAAVIVASCSMALVDQARILLKPIRGALRHLKRLPDADRKLLMELTDAAQDVEDAIETLGDKIGELE